MPLQQDDERQDWFHSLICHPILPNTREHEIKNSEFQIYANVHSPEFLTESASLSSVDYFMPCSLLGYLRGERRYC